MKEADVKTALRYAAAAGWKDAYNRILAFAGSDPFFSLAFITDVHTGNNLRYLHLGCLDALCDEFPFDLLVNGGDIGLDFSADPAVETDAAEEDILQNTKNSMKNVHPWIYVRGNHDRRADRQRLARLFNGDLSPALAGIVFGSELRDYGYLDFPKRKIRVLFLDTTDNDEGVHFSFSPEQLSFVIRTLSGTPDGYRIVVSSHLCPDRYIGKWRSYPNDGEGPVFSALRSVLADFANRRSGEDPETHLSWDFGNAGADLTVVISGDSHFNADILRDGVRYVVRQGYGGVSPSEMPEWATKDAFDGYAEVNFDVLCVKDTGEAKLFRVGAGAGIRDLII